MTKLLSNLLKSVYFNVNRDEKVIIDSNKKKVGTPIQPPPDVLQAIPGFDFVPGMNVVDINQIIKEEKEKEKKNSGEAVQEAKKQAEEILAQAKAEAEAIKKRAYQEGRDDGYLQGRESAKEEFRTLEESLTKKHQESIEELNRQISELEPMFADLVAKLVEKITGILIEDHKDVITYLITQALTNAPKSEKYVIQASKEDVYLLESKKEELKTCLKDNATLSLVENNSLEKNQCIIETDNQMMDCSLDVQLKGLSEELKMLSIESNKK